MGSDFLQAIIEAAERVSGGGDGLINSTDTQIRAGSGTLQIGRSADGQLVALIPADSETKGAPGRSGISLDRLELGDGSGDTEAYLVMLCRRADLEDAFLELVGAMAEAFEHSPDSAAESMFRLFVRWRELFADLPEKHLSRSKLAGLVAELVVLQQAVQILGGSAVDIWQGPDGARHDFLSGVDALEVKATAGNSADQVTVHGVDQLDPPAGGTLHLAVLRVEVGADGPSIDEIFDELVAAGVPPLALREKLRLVGVEPGTTDTAVGCRIVEERLYYVDPSFPRVIRSSFVGAEVPERVSDIRYRISVAGIAPLTDAGAGREWAARTSEET